MKRPVTPAEFCKYAHVSLMTVKRALNRGRIQAKRKFTDSGSPFQEIDLSSELIKFAAASSLEFDVDKILAQYDKDKNSEEEETFQEATNESLSSSSMETGSESTPSLSGRESESTPSLSGREPKTLLEANVMKAKFQAMTAKVQYEKEAGTLIEVSKLRDELESIGVKLQKGVMAIPDRIAAIVAAETDAFRCRRLLVDEFKLALVGIADDIKRISP